MRLFLCPMLPLVIRLWRAEVGTPSGVPVSIVTGRPTPPSARRPHLGRCTAGFLSQWKSKMKTAHLAKSRMDLRDRAEGVSLRSKCSTSAFNAACWFHRKGYFAREDAPVPCPAPAVARPAPTVGQPSPVPRTKRYYNNLGRRIDKERRQDSVSNLASQIADGSFWSWSRTMRLRLLADTGREGRHALIHSGLLPKAIKPRAGVRGYF